MSTKADPGAFLSTDGINRRPAKRYDETKIAGGEKEESSMGQQGAKSIGKDRELWQVGIWLLCTASKATELYALLCPMLFGGRIVIDYTR